MCLKMNPPKLVSSSPRHSALRELSPDQRAQASAILDGVDARLQSEVAALRAEIRVLRGRLLDKLYSKKEVAALAGVSVRTVERRIAEDRYNAEFAVQTELTAISKQFAAMDDAYLASRIQDIKEVAARLIRNLTDRKYHAFSTLREGSIIFAEEITPADTALMEPGRVAAFATTLGGAEGHTAIMARSLAIPAVLGVAGLMQGIDNGQTVIVDGTNGRVIIDPCEATLADYKQRRAALEADRAQLKTLIKLPARTRDLVDVSLQANLEMPRRRSPSPPTVSGCCALSSCS